MNFEQKLIEKFPGAMPEADFVIKSFEAIFPLGFSAINAIACVGLCRDEITLPLSDAIKKTWGESFNFSSLAGMLFLGKMGFLAAQHHSPNEEGKERYVFYAFPHIAIDAEGEVGRCERSGRHGQSTACGALFSFQKEMEGGKLRLGLDFDDVEQSLLKIRLLQEIHYGKVPDLLELTQVTLKVIQTDIERMIGMTVDSNKSDYAVFTGIQIHGPKMNYIWPDACYSVVNGEKQQITLKS